MNNKQFEQCFKQKVEDCKALLFKKAKEYATDEDRLIAFKTAASLENTSPEQALGGMLAKHIVSIFEMIKEPDNYSNAKWDEKINDTINYMILLYALRHDAQDQKVCNADEVEANEKY